MTAGRVGAPAKPRILTVDDDPDLAALISCHVRHWGYASHSVASAAELWASLERETPDVILMDLMLGDRIVIRKKAEPLRLIHPAGHDYFATLRTKLHWGREI